MSTSLESATYITRSGLPPAQQATECHWGGRTVSSGERAAQPLATVKRKNAFNWASRWRVVEGWQVQLPTHARAALSSRSSRTSRPCSSAQRESDRNTVAYPWTVPGPRLRMRAS